MVPTGCLRSFGRESIGAINYYYAFVHDVVIGHGVGLCLVSRVVCDGGRREGRREWRETLVKLNSPTRLGGKLCSN